MLDCTDVGNLTNLLHNQGHFLLLFAMDGGYLAFSSELGFGAAAHVNASVLIFTFVFRHRFHQVPVEE